MWGWVFISEMRLWWSWYDVNHGDDYVLSDIIINIDFLILSLLLFSWSNLVLLSKINIFVWFNEYRGRWPIKHIKCVPWHCPPKHCGLTLLPTPVPSRRALFGPGESSRMLVSSALAASGAQGTSGLWHPAHWYCIFVIFTISKAQYIICKRSNPELDVKQLMSNIGPR